MTDIEDLLAKPQALAVLRAMGELDRATPAELAAATGFAARTQSGWVQRLRAVGLLGGTKQLVELTDTGRAHVPRRAALAGAGDLDEVLAAVWPTEYHRAFIRLMISAVLARWHLRRSGPPGHLGFVATGATGTGKSTMGKFVADALGLAPAEHTLWLPRQTAGSLIGRRTNLPGGGIRLDPSPHLARPLVLLEEADKQDDRALVRTALSFLQGELVTVEEGAQLEWLCTPMMTANARARDLLPAEYTRRCAVLDTHHFADLCEDLPARLRQLGLDGGPPLLDIEALRPPADHLGDEAMAVMAAWLDGGGIRTGDRWEPALEAAALGRAALAGSDDLALAAAETAIDFLTVGDTIGRTTPGWTVKVDAGREALAGDPRRQALVQAFDEVQRHRRDLDASVRTRRVGHQVEDLELTRARAQLVARLEAAAKDITTVPRGDREEAAGIRASMAKLRKQAGQVRSIEALGDIDHLAQSFLEEAGQMRARIDQERQAHATQIEEQRRQEADNRRRVKEGEAWQRQEAKNRKAAAARQLDQLRDQLRPLEAMWRRTSTKAGERPLDQLAALRVDGQPVLRYERAPQPAQVGKLERLLAGRPAPGRWVAPGVGTWAGYPTSCPGLAEWGRATRAVLEVALVPLYAREVHLEQVAGRKHRAGRCQLTGRQ